MNLADRGSGPDGLGWRCLRKGVRRRYHCALERFLVLAIVTLSGSHLEISTILHLWSTKTPVGKMTSELSVSSFRQ